MNTLCQKNVHRLDVSIANNVCYYLAKRNNNQGRTLNEMSITNPPCMALHDALSSEMGRSPRRYEGKNEVKSMMSDIDRRFMFKKVLSNCSDW